MTPVGCVLLERGIKALCPLCKIRHRVTRIQSIWRSIIKKCYRRKGIEKHQVIISEALLTSLHNSMNGKYSPGTTVMTRNPKTCPWNEFWIILIWNNGALAPRKSEYEQKFHTIKGEKNAFKLLKTNKACPLQFNLTGYSFLQHKHDYFLKTTYNDLKISTLSEC